MEKTIAVLIYKTHRVKHVYKNLVAYSGRFSILDPNGQLLSNLRGSIGRNHTGVVWAELSLSSSLSYIFGFFGHHPVCMSLPADGEREMPIPGLKTALIPKCRFSLKFL